MLAVELVEPPEEVEVLEVEELGGAEDPELEPVLDDDGGEL